ncbi:MULTISPECIES: phage regulatory CII family protein [Alphaproteobacteria]|uniref:phage regulatory CII family protein n=1 Tax=Alphaproteobacteria TaxID=28211 RepID=UPI003267440A
MSLPRQTTDEQRRLLKLATRRAVKLGGGQEAVAAITRVTPQTINDYTNSQNQRHNDTFVPLDVLMDLILDAADEAGRVSPILEEICRQSGGSFVPLPKAQRTSAPWHQELSCAVKEGGEAAAKICSALADDGQVSAEEIRDGELLRELQEAIDAYAVIFNHCKHVLEGGE